MALTPHVQRHFSGAAVVTEAVIELSDGVTVLSRYPSFTGVSSSLTLSIAVTLIGRFAAAPAIARVIA